MQAKKDSEDFLKSEKVKDAKYLELLKGIEIVD